MALNMKNYKGYDKKPYCNAHYPKQSFTIVTDTPENLRLRQQSMLQSQVKYRKDYEAMGSQGVPQGGYVPSQVWQDNKMSGPSKAPSHRGVHQYIMEMAHRPGIIVAPVLPGAYYPKAHTLGNSYMHQTSMHSLRSMQHRSHVSVYRALYDYVSQDTDEVSFRDGDIIHGVQPIDGGWVYGTVERTGRSGMLPANYIQGLR